MELSEIQIQNLNFGFAIISQTSDLSFQLILSALVGFYSLIMILLLKRTSKLGELIMMVNEMISEL